MNFVLLLEIVVPGLILMEILQMDKLPKYVWFQLGIENDKAAMELEEAGIKVVQNACMLVELRHLKNSAPGIF